MVVVEGWVGVGQSVVVIHGKMTFTKEKKKKVTHPPRDEGPAVLTLSKKKKKRLFDPTGKTERASGNWARLGSRCNIG